MVTDWIETGKQIVNGIGNGTQRPVGNPVNSRGKAGWNFFYMLYKGIFENEGNVIKNKLIVKGVEVNHRSQKNQANGN